ncbi:hypothetical protein ACFV0R_18995 [Streptomyces sp. NPDC059578]|uniref:hypothetical protein n=1 Tax=Streptomyces sp. NPDC059578 TaxID=3346874 RepID=UPI00369D7C89
MPNPACNCAALPDQRGRHLCPTCSALLRQRLVELPHQVTVLRALLVPPGAPRTGTLHHAGTSRPPVRLDILTLLGPASTTTAHTHPDDQDPTVPIHATLHGWAHLLAQGRRRPRLTAGSIPTLAATLNQHTEWIAHQTWAGACHDELTALVLRLRRITHTHPTQRPCPAPCICGAFGLIDRDWDTYIECTVCHRLYTPAEYRDHARTVMPQLARTALALLTNGQPSPSGTP